MTLAVDKLDKKKTVCAKNSHQQVGNDTDIAQ